MDIANRFDAGGAIATLRQARNDVATTNFNDMIDDINTKASDTESLMGGIQKAGASVVAIGAIGKGVFTKGKSVLDMIKAKVSGNNSTNEGGTEATEDAGGEGGDVEMTGTITETPYTTASDADAVAPSNINADRGGDFGEEEEGDTADLPPEPTEGLGEVDAPSFLQSTGATSNEVEEGVDLGAEATTDAAESGVSSLGSALQGLVSSASNAIGDVANTATNVVSGIGSAVDAATSATTGAIDATTGAVDAGAIAGEVAGSAGLEAAGAALDATGIGAPIGLILNILGGLVLGGTMTAGIVGEVDAGNQQTDATAEAQNQLKSATSGAVAGIAGRYGV